MPRSPSSLISFLSRPLFMSSRLMKSSQNAWRWFHSFCNGFIRGSPSPLSCRNQALEAPFPDLQHRRFSDGNLISQTDAAPAQLHAALLDEAAGLVLRGGQAGGDDQLDRVQARFGYAKIGEVFGLLVL